MVRLHEESERYLSGHSGGGVRARRRARSGRPPTMSGISRSRPFRSFRRSACRSSCSGYDSAAPAARVAPLCRVARRLSQAPAVDRRHRGPVRTVAPAAAGRPRGLAARGPRPRGAARSRGLPRGSRAGASAPSIATACRTRCSASSRCARCSSSPSTTTPITSSRSPAAAELRRGVWRTHCPP